MSAAENGNLAAMVSPVESGCADSLDGAAVHPAMLSAASLRADEGRSACPLFTDPYAKDLLAAAAALLRLLALARLQGGDVGDGQFSDIGGAIAAHAQVLKFCTGRAIREVDRHPAGANIGDRILAVAAYAGGGTCRGANDHRVATSVGQDNAVLVTDARGANESEFR